MSYNLTISRTLKRNRDQTPVLNEFKSIISILPKWKITKVEDKSNLDILNQIYDFKYKLYFTKDGGKQTDSVVENEWIRLVNKFRDLAGATKWQGKEWEVADINPDVKEQQASIIADDSQSNFIINNIVGLKEVKERALSRIENILGDQAVLEKEFHGIFDRDPQIRILMSAIRSFLESDGSRRNHALLYGLPACAKTQILLRLKTILGEDAVLRLDATSTTSAGIYKLFFDDLQGDVPPFVIIEEIEKTTEEALRVWLGALDDRGELRKINYRQSQVKHIKVLCLATANDKVIFDKLMGGSERKPGALSSRFVNQVHCPRPDRKILELILRRDINKYGGHEDWIKPCLDLAEEIDTNDPRRVLSFLDGGDRLISGEYQKDILHIANIEKNEDNGKIKDSKLAEYCQSLITEGNNDDI